MLLSCKCLTGPAVTQADTALRENSRTTREATREPTTASITDRNKNWRVPLSPNVALAWCLDFFCIDVSLLLLLLLELSRESINFKAVKYKSMISKDTLITIDNVNHITVFVHSDEIKHNIQYNKLLNYIKRPIWFGPVSHVFLNVPVYNMVIASRF